MRRAAVVANPTKLAGEPELRAELDAIFDAYGWAPPLWLETTRQDPGTGQARRAARSGVDLVCALGGDGTVRGVAAGLLGSGLPLGLLAAGTGNVLARNLGLPHQRYADGLRVALAGRDSAIDVMRVELDREGDGRFDQVEVGTVMTGIHLDAEIIANTNETLKRRLGWLAYPAAGTRFLAHRRIGMRIESDRGEVIGPVPLTTALVGNCGKLTGGIWMMPGATAQDGTLDVALLSVGRVVGWIPLVVQVFSRSRRSTRSIRRLRGSTLTIRCDEPAMVEVDGDVLGRAHGIRLAVEPLALPVRMR